MRKLLFILIVLVVGACGNNAPALRNAESADLAMMELAPGMESDNTPAASTTERKLIKRGNLSFEVEDLTKTRVIVDALCKKTNAYISSENQHTYEDRKLHQLEIRIPSAKYDSLVVSLEALALKVETKSTTIEDVTTEFIDIEARLKTKRELEARYLSLLQQAKKVEEILSIETHLATVRADIESMEGRLNYLSNQVTYSTLSLSYFQLIDVDYGFGTKFSRAMGAGWENLLSFIIGLVNLWPFAILLIAGWWLIRRARRRKQTQDS